MNPELLPDLFTAIVQVVGITALALIIVGMCFVWRICDSLEIIAEAIEHQTVHISGTDCQSPSVVGELPTPVESSAAEGIHGNDGVQ